MKTPLSERRQKQRKIFYSESSIIRRRARAFSRSKMEPLSGTPSRILSLSRNSSSFREYGMDGSRVSQRSPSQRSPSQLADRTENSPVSIPAVMTISITPAGRKGEIASPSPSYSGSQKERMYNSVADIRSHCCRIRYTREEHLQIR